MQLNLLPNAINAFHIHTMPLINQGKIAPLDAPSENKVISRILNCILQGIMTIDIQFHLCQFFRLASSQQSFANNFINTFNKALQLRDVFVFH